MRVSDITGSETPLQAMAKKILAMPARPSQAGTTFGNLLDADSTPKKLEADPQGAAMKGMLHKMLQHLAAAGTLNFSEKMMFARIAQPLVCEEIQVHQEFIAQAEAHPGSLAEYQLIVTKKLIEHGQSHGLHDLADEKARLLREEPKMIEDMKVCVRNFEAISAELRAMGRLLSNNMSQPDQEKL